MKTLLFVDDDARVLQGLQRQLRGARHEWDMHFLGNGNQALEFMASQPVDVVVTDIMMPGMDGAQLLAKVMKTHPNTVRIVLSGHTDRETVLRLVGLAHQYLSKPCDAEELRGAIERSFALRELLANKRLKELATRTRCLPSLPSLHLQLSEEMRQDEPSLERIGEIISQDIAMTSKIMQLVNSAFFGLSQPISSATEAVTYLGLGTVQALVLSIRVFSQFELSKISEFSLDGLAQHCWLTGMFARRIARAEKADHKIDDQCFLAGMLHDVGRLILITGLPEEYERVLRAANEEKIALWQAELSVFGTTHAEVGGYLLGLWGLPNQVVEAVAFHHRLADGTARGFSPLLAVHLANAFAHEQSGTQDNQPGNVIEFACIEELGLAGRMADWRAACFDNESQN